MIVVNANSLSSLSIGRHGENLARQVVFDVSDWEAEYGHGVVELIAQRPGDEKPYPVAVKRDGTQVIWNITSVDTAIVTHEHPGKCELRYYVGETLAKSKIWRTWVEPALPTPSETAPPEPEQGWVDQVLAAGAAAMTAADGAKADADRAAGVVQSVSDEGARQVQAVRDEGTRQTSNAKSQADAAKLSADAAAQSATDAANAKTGADTAKDAAVTAQGKAEDAKKGAEVAKTASEASKKASAKSEAAAKASEANAAGSASAAAESATAAQTAQSGAEAAKTAAAQSAQQAAESAAVYDDVVADVTQLKQDIVTKADKTDLAKTDRSLDALWKLNQGISYQFETDDAESYQKTVPTGAKLASVEVIGGKTVVWNHPLKINATTGDMNGITYDIREDGMATLNGTTTGVFSLNIGECSVQNGHIYLCLLIGYGYNLNSGCVLLVNSWKFSIEYNTIKTSNITTSGDARIRFTDGRELNGNYRLIFADLTAMFGAMNEPTSTDDPRIDWIKQYAAAHPEYNEGELVSADIESVKYNDAVVAEIPESVRNLPGYGWSVGDVCNSVERTETGWQYVQRVGSRDYLDGDTVTDGVTTYYVLDTPVITDITELMADFPDNFEVEAGGTLTFENTAKLDVPNTVEYVVKLSEVGA